MEDIDFSGTKSTNNSINNSDELAHFIDSNRGTDIGDSEIARNIKSSRYSVLAGEHGLTVFSGGLAIISTCVGGGIVGLPLAFYRLGLPVAIVLMLFVTVSTIYAARMYLAIKDSLPDRPESLYEIGYMLVGRSSIFIIAGVLIINSFGLCMIYFIVFGDTFGHLMASLLDNGHAFDTIYYTERWFYDLILAALLVLVILKKELAELAWVSYVLFGSLGLFVVLNFV